MTRVRHQFRLSTLFHVTTAVAFSAALFRAVGFDGIALLLFLASLPFLVVFLVVIYIRAMSWLFDLIVGPFLLR